MKSSVKFPQSVMIWGAMSSAGVGPLCFLKTNVTAPVYQEILEHFMLPSADQLFKDADFIFQQDLAPAHTQGRRQGGAFAGRAPPNELLCPPTFHPLLSLLNVIDLESESETDKTVHIRTRLHAFSERQQLHTIKDCTITPPPPPPPPTHTHTHTHTHTQRDLCPP